MRSPVTRSASPAPVTGAPHGVKPLGRLSPLKLALVHGYTSAWLPALRDELAASLWESLRAAVC